MFGRQAEKLQESVEFYKHTMQLLRDLKEGAVSIAQVEIDASGWRLK